MDDATIRALLLGAIGVAVIAAAVYQVFMLRWSKRVVNGVPRIVIVLRVVNLVLLIGAAALVIWWLARVM